jgi:hypothetical protein
MQPPNKALQLKWFYMSFHSEDLVKYVESARCLCDETLESVAGYLRNIFNLQVADGSLGKKCKHQIEHCVRHEMHHALIKQYNKKVHHIKEQCQGSDGCHSRQSNTYHCHNYDKCKKKQENKIPSDRGDKAFKPCSTHGPKSNQTYKECYKNLKNQNKHQAHDKNLDTRRITTTRITQVTTMSRVLVSICRPQEKTRCQPQAKAKTMRMRTIIFMLIKN